MMLQLRRVPIVATLAVACVGCGGHARTPADVAGEYVMVERNGHRLPDVMPALSGGRSCSAELVRDVLTLRADGWAVERIEGRTWCEGEPRPDALHVERAPGFFKLLGARGDSITITLSHIAPPEVMRGEVRGDELRVHDVATTPEPSFRYVRRHR